jgi:hypothetical protein
MDVEVADLEREICRIPDVTATRIVTDDSGSPVEVHILSLPSKHPKQVVRDVQSVAMARFGVDLDRRVISVVQLDSVATATLAGDASPEFVDGERVTVDEVGATRTGLHSNTQVVLRLGEAVATGTAEGLVATSTMHRLAAHATLAALRQLEPGSVNADIETAMIVRIGDRAVAVVTVIVIVPPYEEVVAGSAVVRAAGELDAVARAVLDATNRRLPQLR